MMRTTFVWLVFACSLPAAAMTIETVPDKFQNATRVYAPSNLETINYSPGRPTAQLIGQYKGLEPKGKPSLHLSVAYAPQTNAALIDCGSTVIFLIDGKTTKLATRIPGSPIRTQHGLTWIYSFPVTPQLLKQLTAGQRVEFQFCGREVEVQSEWQQTWREAFGT